MLLISNGATVLVGEDTVSVAIWKHCFRKIIAIIVKFDLEVYCTGVLQAEAHLHEAVEDSIHYVRGRFCTNGVWQYQLLALLCCGRSSYQTWNLQCPWRGVHIACTTHSQIVVVSKPAYNKKYQMCMSVVEDRPIWYSVLISDGHHSICAQHLQYKLSVCCFIGCMPLQLAMLSSLTSCCC